MITSLTKKYPESEWFGDTEAALERYYTPDEVAQAWRLDVKSIRKLFRSEKGVLVLGRSQSTYGKRAYTTLRIPQSVLERVRRRMTA